MQSRFTKTAKGALDSALSSARALGHTYVGTEHILLGLLSEKNGIAYKILYARGINYDSAKDLITEGYGKGAPTKISADSMTRRARAVIESSAFEAIKYGQPYIGTEHLLITLVCENDCTGAQIITNHGVRLSDLFTDTVAFLDNGQSPSITQNSNKEKKALKISDISALQKYGKNLNELAESGTLDPLFGREDELEAVIKTLMRRSKNNPCLIGEAGVGKTAIVEGLAQRIVNGFVPNMLKDKVIFSLDLPAMLAGAKYRGEFEDRLKNVMNELNKNPEIILFIDEIHTIAGAGAAEGAIDASNILKPSLARGQIHIIGATTTAEYRKIIEKDSALERRFCKINISEPTISQCKEILYGLRPIFQKHHSVKISDEAIDCAINLSVRYINDRYLPDKALDLIDEASSSKHLYTGEQNTELIAIKKEMISLSDKKDEYIRQCNFEQALKIRKSEEELKEKYDLIKSKYSKDDSFCPDVTGQDIARVITAHTGIPTENVTKNEAERLSNLEHKLGELIIGQKKAIQSVAKAVRRGRIGLKSPNRPTGSFIFTGPSGVGKTELCRAIAKTVFSDKDSLIKIDMSEYTEPHSVSRLTGSPPGYVGHEEGGQLTEWVRSHPYSVVLFDEIEKAHPDVINILLQILDEGILTDALGHKVDFKNCIIVLTSNISTEKHSATVGFGDKKENEKLYSALKSFFRPELLNRIDEIIVFDSLSKSELSQIAELMLKDLIKRIESLGITAEYEYDSCIKLSELCTENTGARELYGIIRDKIEDKLAEMIIDKKINQGDFIKLCVSENSFDWTIKNSGLVAV